MIVVAVIAPVVDDVDFDVDGWPWCRRVSGDSSAFLSLCLSVSTSHLKIILRAMLFCSCG